MTPGETEGRFSWLCRVKAVGLAVEGIPTDDARLLGIGGASLDFQPIITQRRTTPPKDVRAWLARLRGPGGSSEALRNVSFARSISSSSPRFSALRSALDQDRSPFRPVDETFGIPFASPANLPSVLHPEGLRFLGVLLGWLAHSINHTTSDPRKQEMRTLILQR